MGGMVVTKGSWPEETTFFDRECIKVQRHHLVMREALDWTQLSMVQDESEM
jgi:hypothetical protein